MSYRRIPDGDGHSITLFDRDGRLFLTQRMLKTWLPMTHMTSRDDDVLICAYPKSGLHWMWEIITMLVTGSTDLTTKRLETNGFLMVASPTELDSLPSPRVLSTHRPFHELPSDFIIKRRKIVCIIRDPKDVCVSYYHMLKSVKHADYDGTFDGFLTLFLNGHVPFNTWASWVLSLEKGLKEHPELSVHVVHYEQLKTEPVREIQRLAEYLAVNISHDLAHAIAMETQFSAMKSFKENYASQVTNKYYKGNTDSIFREGQAGSWKPWFSTQQAKHFDAQLQKQLGRPSIKCNL